MAEKNNIPAFLRSVISERHVVSYECVKKDISIYYIYIQKINDEYQVIVGFISGEFKTIFTQKIEGIELYLIPTQFSSEKLTIYHHTDKLVLHYRKIAFLCFNMRNEIPEEIMKNLEEAQKDWKFADSFKLFFDSKMSYKGHYTLEPIETNILSVDFDNSLQYTSINVNNQYVCMVQAKFPKNIFNYPNEPISKCGLRIVVDKNKICHFYDEIFVKLDDDRQLDVCPISDKNEIFVGPKI